MPKVVILTTFDTINDGNYAMISYKNLLLVETKSESNYFLCLSNSVSIKVPAIDKGSIYCIDDAICKFLKISGVMPLLILQAM